MRQVKIVKNELTGGEEKILAVCTLEEGASMVEIELKEGDAALLGRLRGGILAGIFSPTGKPVVRPEDGAAFLDALKNQYNDPSLYAEETGKGDAT